MASDPPRLIAQKIIYMLGGRSGFDAWWSSMDDDVREEIVDEIAKFIPSGSRVA